MTHHLRTLANRPRHSPELYIAFLVNSFGKTCMTLHYGKQDTHLLGWGLQLATVATPRHAKAQRHFGFYFYT